mmetsp:Transcript_5674/g.12815  ORF Transcript_5674/g.12815 Transcript_5674/m.12815 type:complete len:210 (-) Transcript_5674:328-957(-)
MVCGVAATNPGGVRTASMMCTIPFEANLLVTVTVTSVFSLTLPSTAIVMLSPFSIVASVNVMIFAAGTRPAMTWYCNTSESAVTLANRAWSVPFGSASKAAFVGANTVKSPGLESNVTRSAAFNASTNVDRSESPAAISAIDSLGAMRTLSITCTMPFDAITSTMTSSVATLLILTPLSPISMMIFFPFNIVASDSVITVLDGTTALTT